MSQGALSSEQFGEHLSRWTRKTLSDHLASAHRMAVPEGIGGQGPLLRDLKDWHDNEHTSSKNPHVP